MEKYITRKIRVSNLILNVENPRFEIVGNQRDALEIMITEIGSKILVLAEDIVKNGVNPSELVIAIQENKNNFRVLEGNRRVAALKLLSTPEMFKDKHKSFTNKMSKIAKNWNKSSQKELQCVVFSDVDDANKWIELKHTGENKGRGVVSWDAQQTARFNSMMEKKESVGLQVLNFLKDNYGPEVDKILKKVSITNLERLLTDKNVQSVLGVQVSNGVLETTLMRDEVKKGLLKIINDIASKKVKVKDIYTKDDRKKYIETFKPGIDIPDSSKQADNIWQISSTEQQSPAVTKRKRRIALSTDRQTLIPRKCVIQIQEAKINKIYSELKDINVDDFSNAVSVLFRVFLELSIDAFDDKYSFPRKDKKGKLISLRERLKRVAEHMERNGMANKNELKGLRVLTQAKDSLYSVDTFNDYVHNRHFSPVAKDLKTNWDNVQVFMEKLWSNV